MRIFAKKISVRLSDKQDKELNRIGRHLGGVKVSKLVKEGIGMLIAKYPGPPPKPEPTPIFDIVEKKKRPGRNATRSDKKRRRPAKK